MSAEIDEAKQAIRRRVWDLLVAERVVERGVHGYIPAFVGAEAAADRLAGLTEWRAAKVVKAVPDRAQQPVRERALRDGKLLYVAVPKLAAELPFFVLDGIRVRGCRFHGGHEGKEDSGTIHSRAVSAAGRECDGRAVEAWRADR